MEKHRAGAGIFEQHIAQPHQLVGGDFAFARVQVEFLTVAPVIAKAVAVGAPLGGSFGQQTDFIGDDLNALFARFQPALDENWIVGGEQLGAFSYKRRARR